ncbi:MAG: hypothetical protein LUH11_04435, partial [Candidatus Gastranaerophilales bacterium]|nr:hypothetical protein [Candidatus Gastranaerophilales bacterium]
MHSLFSKLKLLFIACRGYSVPISVMSWIVPFIFGVLNGGNISLGIISLSGIVILHSATNIFDDAIDYTKEITDIKKGIKGEFNFQKSKCICII